MEDHQRAAGLEARVPQVTLEAKAERNYVRDVVSILKSSRLNNYYPDARKLSSHLACMSPERHGGLYPGLDIDLRSGLPTYREWTRIKTDHAVAPQSLTEMNTRERQTERARAKPTSIYGKQLLKRNYYESLVSVRLASLSHMDVALRRIEPEHRTAHFHVILDKLDVSGTFVRYTIDLAQTGKAWSQPMVTLSEDTAGHTEEFRSLIYQFTSLDSEFTFAKLISMGGVTVERVVKGTVGPFYFSGMKAPAPIRQMLEGRQGFVATFSLDMAAVDIASDKDNDPLDELVADRLSETARQTYDEVRAQAGYRVFKDRKFVVSQGLTAAVNAWCKAAGTRNIIYACRPARA